MVLADMEGNVGVARRLNKTLMQFYFGNINFLAINRIRKGIQFMLNRIKSVLNNTVIVSVLLGATLIPSMSYAESQKTMCQNSGALGKSFAEARDRGMPFEEISANIDSIGKKGNMTADDVLRAQVTVMLVYTDLKKRSPDQIRQNFYSQCMTENKR